MGHFLLPRVATLVSHERGTHDGMRFIVYVAPSILIYEILHQLGKVYHFVYLKADSQFYLLASLAPELPSSLYVNRVGPLLPSTSIISFHSFIVLHTC